MRSKPGPLALTASAPALGHQDDPEAVRILEGGSVLARSGVGRSHRLIPRRSATALTALLVAPVEDDEGLGMRRRRRACRRR